LIALKHRCVRRFHTSLRMRTVTCSAPRRNLLRATCGTFLRRDFRFRPAPRLAPPQRGRGRSCWIGFMFPAYAERLTRLGSDTPTAPKAPHAAPHSPPPGMRCPPIHLESADIHLLTAGMITSPRRGAVSRIDPHAWSRSGGERQCPLQPHSFRQPANGPWPWFPRSRQRRLPGEGCDRASGPPSGNRRGDKPLERALRSTSATTAPKRKRAPPTSPIPTGLPLGRRRRSGFRSRSPTRPRRATMSSRDFLCVTFRPSAPR